MFDVNCIFLIYIEAIIDCDERYVKGDILTLHTTSRYSIDKMEDGQGFIIDALIKICLPIGGDLYCVPDNGIHILKQQSLPVCSADFYSWIKGKAI